MSVVTNEEIEAWITRTDSLMEEMRAVLDDFTALLWRLSEKEAPVKAWTSCASAARAVLHATEEDVDRALNCEQGPETHPPFQSALQTGLKAWREAGRPTPPDLPLRSFHHLFYPDSDPEVGF